MEIIAYDPIYREYVKTLNVEWLSTFFRVEPIDELELGNPEKYILEKGGSIFFCKDASGIAGTVSLIPRGQELELGKMAVTPSAQGKGYGAKLLEYSIQEARKAGYKSIFLFSNRKLVSAIHLYRKYGFQEVPLGQGLYERANIKMQLDL